MGIDRHSVLRHSYRIVQTENAEPMEDDILRVAQAEAGRLEGLLHEHPIYQRLQAVRRIIELYGGSDAPLPIADRVPSPLGKQGPRPGSQASAIRNGAERYLREKGRPAP